MKTTLLLALLLCQGCAHTVVIQSDQRVQFVAKGQPAPEDGVFLSTAEYRRMRQAIADAIQRESGK